MSRNRLEIFIAATLPQKAWFFRIPFTIAVNRSVSLPAHGILWALWLFGFGFGFGLASWAFVYTNAKNGRFPADRKSPVLLVGGSRPQTPLSRISSAAARLPALFFSGPQGRSQRETLSKGYGEISPSSAFVTTKALLAKSIPTIGMATAKMRFVDTDALLAKSNLSDFEHICYVNFGLTFNPVYAILSSVIGGAAMKIVGERLRTLREGVGLSQSRMAKTFGAGQSSIYRYESGEAGVPAELLAKYANYFDVSLDYIFGRTDDPHGMYCEARPKVEKSYPEMDKFIEMCFEPGSAMNERLKETLRRMMREDA